MEIIMDPDSIAKIAKALAEPARLAIEKLSGGIGRVYEPTHIRRIAAANADKAFIKAVGQQDLAALLETAKHRDEFRKIRQEMNLNLIADRAAHLFADGIPDDASAPSDEWVDEFTDQSKDASSDELRELWSRLYVAETKCSGAVPRRVLRVVRDLDASLARSFTKVLACCITNAAGQIILLLFDACLEGLDFTDRNLRELQDVGLMMTPPIARSQIGTGLYEFNRGKLLALTFGETKWWNPVATYMTSAGIAIAAVAEKDVNERYVQNLCAAATAAGAKAQYPVNVAQRSGAARG